MRDETPLWATETDGEDATSERSGRPGWEILADPLLRALIGRSPRDLRERTAALEAFAALADPAAPIAPDVPDAPDTGEVAARSLPARREALDVLRDGGWIEAGAAAGSLRWTEAGRRAYGAVARLKEAADLPAGAAPARSLRTLTAGDFQELAEAGREALLAILPPPPLLTSEALAHAAELQVLRSVKGGPPPGPLAEPPEVPHGSLETFPPVEAERLLADLAAIARLGRPVSFAVLDAGNAGETGLRLGLLTLVGTGAIFPMESPGIAARLAALPLAVEPGSIVPLSSVSGTAGA
jgi:hypothetical protein